MIFTPKKPPNFTKTTHTTPAHIMPERFAEMLMGGIFGGITRWMLTISPYRNLRDSLCFLLKSIIAAGFLAVLAYYVSLGWGLFVNNEQAISLALLMGFAWQIMMPFLDRFVKKKTEEQQ